MGISPEDPAADGTATPAPSGRSITVFPGVDWTESYAFIDWMQVRILRRLPLTGTDTAAEFGCPLGIWPTIYCAPTRTVARAVACIDRHARPLAEFSSQSRFIPVRGSVEDVASGRVRLPHDGYDVMLVRETLDSLSDPGEVIAGLAGLLGPGGRMLLVTQPPAAGHPLFAAAAEAFARQQPDPERIAAGMRAAGLNTELSYDSYPLTFSTRKWLRMVRERYVPVLSQFSDAQLETGTAEIQQAHPGTRVGFEDTYAFILGNAP